MDFKQKALKHKRLISNFVLSRIINKFDFWTAIETGYKFANHPKGKYEKEINHAYDKATKYYIIGHILNDELKAKM